MKPERPGSVRALKRLVEHHVVHARRPHRARVKVLNEASTVSAPDAAALAGINDSKRRLTCPPLTDSQVKLLMRLVKAELI
jgi:hypothetical protein